MTSHLRSERSDGSLSTYPQAGRAVCLHKAYERAVYAPRSRQQTTATIFILRKLLLPRDLVAAAPLASSDAAASSSPIFLLSKRPLPEVSAQEGLDRAYACRHGVTYPAPSPQTFFRRQPLHSCLLHSARRCDNHISMPPPHHALKRRLLPTLVHSRSLQLASLSSSAIGFGLWSSR